MPPTNDHGSPESSMDRLKQLTASLGPPEGIITAPGIKQYKTTNGTVLSWTIHWQHEFAICHAFLSAGATMSQHIHEEKEWIIVISGGIAADIEGEKVKIEPRQELVVEPHTPHEVRTETDTYLVIITMPASEDLPKRPVHFY